jgi:hypothetical protein
VTIDDVLSVERRASGRGEHNAVIMPTCPSSKQITSGPGQERIAGPQNLPRSFALSLQSPSKFGDLLGQLGEPP